MSKTTGSHILRDALFLDIPYIVDSVLRHAEYRLNRLHRPMEGEAPRLKSCLTHPSFVLLVVVLLFAAYGPTFGALCGVFEASSIEDLQRRFGALCIFLAMLQFIVSVVYFHFRIERRFAKMQLAPGVRWVVVHAVFIAVLFAWALPLAFVGEATLAGIAHDGCRAQPAHWPSAVQLGTLLLATVGVAWRSVRAASLRARMAWQAGAITALVVSLSLLPGAGPWTEAAQVPYVHVFGIVAVGLALIAWAANWLVRIPFRSVSGRERASLQQALRSIELFPTSREDPELSPRRIFGGLVVGVLQKPLQFLLLPSFAVLFVSERYLWHGCVVGTVASALLITASTLTARWDRMAQYLRRYLLVGIPFVVSAAAIVIAAMRLLGVQYVTTLLNVAPFGALFVWMVMAYVVGWWFEYQVNSVLASKLLGMFGTEGDWDHRLVAYEPDALAHHERSRVEPGQRYLTGHGMGELVVVGRMLEHSSHKTITAFHAYSFLELFDTLLGRRDAQASHEITRRIQLYFALVNLLLAVGLGLLAWHWGRGDRLNTVSAMVLAQREPPPAPSPADLAALLTDDGTQPGRSALVVSASGGGTRAAIYAASLLEGLHRLGADSRIVLLSGVSGGGVAAAYFHGHRAALLDDRRERCDGARQEAGTAWQCYRERMAMPFIDDVLRGASEWRIQSEQPLGVLLAESFERRLFTRDGQALRLGQDPGVGLILNTTLTGAPLHDAPMLDGTLVRLPQARAGPCQDHQRPVSALAGGRLAFSNLRDIGAFDKADPDLPAIRMPFVVVRDPSVGLAQAAALNANFPPVFPNARVDLRGFAQGDPAACDVRSYYVTDGGATENLGLISALLALHSALDRLDGMPHADRRDIDIVLAEASAFDFDYAQDRGVGAAAADAKERLTGRLTLELLAQLERRMAPAEVRVHDLSLPRVFRSRGGFGTHWTFPGSVRVENPLLTPQPPEWIRVVAQYTGLDRHWVTLDREQLFALWGALFEPGSVCERSWLVDPQRPSVAQDLTAVTHWICGRSAHGERIARPDPLPARWHALQRRIAAEAR